MLNSPSRHIYYGKSVSEVFYTWWKICEYKDYNLGVHTTCNMSYRHIVITSVPSLLIPLSTWFGTWYHVLYIRFIFWLVGTGINSKFCWLRPNNRTVIEPCSYDMVNMGPFIFISCLFECIFFLLTVQNVLQQNQSVPSCPSIESISGYQNKTVLLLCSLIYKVNTAEE